MFKQELITHRFENDEASNIRLAGKDIIIYYPNSNSKIYYQVSFNENGEINLLYVDSINYEFDAGEEVDVISKEIYAYIDSHKMLFSELPLHRTCEFCEEWFIPKSKNRKYCYSHNDACKIGAFHAKGKK